MMEVLEAIREADRVVKTKVRVRATRWKIPLMGNGLTESFVSLEA